jgi:deazaflavin-dependent oxidoreductase (nitroreductase family)
MVMQVAMVAGAVVVGLVAIALVFVAGWRRKSRFVFSPLIGLQRAVINPRQLQSAGTPGAYAALIRHVGRTSGRPYQTPVGAVATDDGFLVALMYGSRTNWLRNVLAAGSATIVHEGETHAVDRPELVPMRTVAAQFSAGDQRGFRWLGVDQALRVRRVVQDGAGERVSHATPSEGATGGSSFRDAHSTRVLASGDSPVGTGDGEARIVVRDVRPEDRDAALQVLPRGVVKA